MSDEVKSSGGEKAGFDAREAARKVAEKREGSHPGPDARSAWDKMHDRVDKINRQADRDRQREKEAQDRARENVAARHRENVLDESTHVPCRILWPALGFPAVIAPNGGDKALAARTICLLVLSDRDPKRNPLSKKDVARHLRVVPWAKRREKRYYKPGGPESFAEEEIGVSPREPFLDDGRAELVAVGGGGTLQDPDRTNCFVVGISTWIRKFYSGALKDFPVPAKKRLPHLYEIRIAEPASARLGTGRFHLFWVNRGRNDDGTVRSDEMDTIIEHYGRHSRFNHDGVIHPKRFSDRERPGYEGRMMREYEYEYDRPEGPSNRVEVLHPLFIESVKPELKIGHITDIHLDIRTKTYAERISASGDGTAKAHFHDWNEACRKLYEESKQTSDVLMMTGDLIDYGRGYNERGPLGEDKSYWRDRNWFMFYEFLAGGDKYAKPAYTSLGNHDWRINPYPPFTFGAPDPKDFALSKQELKEAHGEDYDRFTYATALRMVGSFIRWKVQGEGRLNIPGSPLETRVESVTWYLLLINPFLDYAWHLPGGYQAVMLDWADDEEVDLEVILGGVSRGRNVFPNTSGGPKAKNILTKVQKELVAFVASGTSKAKILAIHAPPIGPWDYWKDDELKQGRVTVTQNDLGAAVDELGVPRFRNVLVGPPRVFEGTDGERADSLKRLRGAEFNDEALAAVASGKQVPDASYPMLAIRTAENDLLGREADYGSFTSVGRHWLIQTLRNAKFSVVLAGHIHRQHVLIIDTVGKDLPAAWRGKWVVRSVEPGQASTAPLPLFVNTTSAGPLGHRRLSRGKYMVAASGYTVVNVASGGSISKVEFRPNVAMTPRPAESKEIALPGAPKPAEAAA